MPPTTRPVSRRAALGAAAGVTASAVAGCTGDADRSPRTVTAPPTRRAGTDPDVLLAATVLADERALLARVAATVRRHPRLRADLADARAAHRAHVRLLSRAVPRETSPTSPTASRTASPTAGPTTRPNPRRPAVPAKPGPALAAVAAAEARLSLVGRRSAFSAESGAFARVLASMAAAATQQSTRLSAASRDRA